jgi:hypothetical protein
MPEREREPLAGFFTDLQWRFALDGLNLGVTGDPDRPKPDDHVTLDNQQLALTAVDEQRVRALSEGLDELASYTLRYILTHPGCTLGEVLFSPGAKKLGGISPKMLLDVADKLESEGRIHLMRRWLADGMSPDEKAYKEAMESLESQEYLSSHPEVVERIRQHNPDLIKTVEVPHEPPAGER